jgi:hypothetical protein
MKCATLPPGRQASWALRLTDVRGFARHVANIDPWTEVPSAGILPGLRRAKPYVYTDAEIDALLAAALALPPEGGLVVRQGCFSSMRSSPHSGNRFFDTLYRDCSRQHTACPDIRSRRLYDGRSQDRSSDQRDWARRDTYNAG